MGLFADASSMGSPIQKHRVLVANDLQWIDGQLETLGDPNNYINQDTLDVFTISEPRIAPWAFTGLPSSRPNEIILARENVQFLLFPGEETFGQFHAAPRREMLIINLNLAIVRGSAPFLSEAKLSNFLDFWKGLYFPVTDARIHFLSPSAGELPTQDQLVYINRRAIQSYTHA